MMNTSKHNKRKEKGVAKVEEKNTKSTIETKAEKNTAKKSRKLKMPVVRKIHVHPLYLVLGAVVTILAVFFVRVAVWEHNYLAAMEGSERDVVSSPTIEINESNGEDVDSTEVTEQQKIEWVVAPDKPRYFTIPYLGIYNARIVELGLKGEGEMATPHYAGDVGWYTGSGSVLPGQQGVTFMNAHGGDLGYGIFRTLPKLPVGETIKVEMGDGRVFNYRVVESTRREIGDSANDYMQTAFTPLDATGNTLTLVTCTGDWLQSLYTYKERLFVRAILE